MSSVPPTSALSGKATPFDGWGVSAGIYMTLCGGNLVYVHEKEDM